MSAKSKKHIESSYPTPAVVTRGTKFLESVETTTTALIALQLALISFGDQEGAAVMGKMIGTYAEFEADQL